MLARAEVGPLIVGSRSPPRFLLRCHFAIFARTLGAFESSVLDP